MARPWLGRVTLKELGVTSVSSLHTGQGQFCPCNAGASKQLLTGLLVIYNPRTLTDWRTPPGKNVAAEGSFFPHLRHEYETTLAIQSQMRTG